MKVRSLRGVGLCLALALALCLVPALSQAVTQGQTLALAKQNLTDGMPVDQIVGQALSGWSEGGLAPVDVIAPLAESLLENGIAAGKDGVRYAGAIVCAVLDWSIANNLPMADMARNVSQAVLGIRASLNRHGDLDPEKIKEEIKNCPAMDDVMRRVVDAAYDEVVAATYTPLAPPPFTVPQPNAFDPSTLPGPVGTTGGTATETGGGV